MVRRTAEEEIVPNGARKLDEQADGFEFPAPRTPIGHS